MASAADASTGNNETKTQINVNWTNDEVAAIIDIWANVEIQDDNRALRITIRVYSIGERDSRVVSATKMSRFFSRPC